MKDKQRAGKVDDEQIDNKLRDLHRREVLLPLLISAQRGKEE